MVFFALSLWSFSSVDALEDSPKGLQTARALNQIYHLVCLSLIFFCCIACKTAVECAVVLCSVFGWRQGKVTFLKRGTIPFFLLSAALAGHPLVSNTSRHRRRENPHDDLVTRLAHVSGRSGFTSTKQSGR